MLSNQVKVAIGKWVVFLLEDVAKDKKETVDNTTEAKEVVDL